MHAALVKLARDAGATDAAIIRAADIPVSDHLADLCREPGCPNYGLSPGCPPHVSGPGGFRKLAGLYAHALVFKIDLPSDILLSASRMEAFRALHEIAAEVERAAVAQGWTAARGFAGNACKKIFCDDHPDCPLLEGGDGGTCRYPEAARHSMSGYGVDVTALMELAGWRMGKWPGGAEEGSLSSLCGLTLIG